MHRRSPVSVEEYARLMARSPARWRPYWATLWHTGLRVGELVMLRERDIDLGAGTLTVAARAGWAPKRGSVGVLPLASEVMAVLRPILTGDRERRPFNPRASRLGTRTRCIEAALRRIVAAAALRRDLTPHCLRHAFAHRARDAGVHISVLQHLLRHASLASTGAYLSADLPRLREAVSLMEAAA